MPYSQLTFWTYTAVSEQCFPGACRMIGVHTVCQRFLRRDAVPICHRVPKVVARGERGAHSLAIGIP